MDTQAQFLRFVEQQLENAKDMQYMIGQQVAFLEERKRQMVAPPPYVQAQVIQPEPVQDTSNGGTPSMDKILHALQENVGVDELLFLFGLVKTIIKKPEYAHLAIQWCNVEAATTSQKMVNAFSSAAGIISLFEHEKQLYKLVHETAYRKIGTYRNSKLLL